MRLNDEGIDQTKRAFLVPMRIARRSAIGKAVPSGRQCPVSFQRPCVVQCEKLPITINEYPLSIIHRFALLAGGRRRCKVQKAA
jgi:hypothetical protein